MSILKIFFILPGRDSFVGMVNVNSIDSTHIMIKDILSLDKFRNECDSYWNNFLQQEMIKDFSITF